MHQQRYIFKRVSVSAFVWVFQKQQRIKQAVARRCERRLHMAGKGTSQQVGRKQLGQERHGANWSSCLQEPSRCLVDIMGEMGINIMSVYGENKMRACACMHTQYTF